VNNNGCKGF